MKNNTTFIFVFLTLTMCLSCKSQLKHNEQLNFFEKETVGDFYLLKKRGFKQTNEGNTTSEKKYSIKISKDFKSYSLEISVIPNKVIFYYTGKQKIIVFGNTNMIKKTKIFGVNKNTFKEKLNDLKIDISSIDNELRNLKGKDFYGINIQDDHIIIYLNIPKNKITLFDESLCSFQYLE